MRKAQGKTAPKGGVIDIIQNRIRRYECEVRVVIMHSVQFINAAVVSSSGAIFRNFRITRARISLMLVIPAGQNMQFRTHKDELNDHNLSMENTCVHQLYRVTQVHF